MKRIVTAALAIILLIGCLPVTANAATQSDGKQLGMSAISGSYKTMTSSQELVDMIKLMEGFSATAYWDYSQYTIGFGTKAASSNQVVTVEEAEVMLKSALTSYEKEVNNYCKKIGKQPTQNQFDALVSFTYNVGSSWMSSSRLNTWLRNPTTEMELVNAMGQWVRADGKILYALVQRRMREAIMFNKGVYIAPPASGSASIYNIQSNLQYVSNGALPYYSSVIYQYGYSTSTRNEGDGNAVAYYRIGDTYSDLAEHIPTRTGYTFNGWKITRINNNKTSIGDMVTASTVAGKNVELTAQWTAGSNSSTSTGSGGSSDSGSVEVKLPFLDVNEDDWFYDDIRYVYENELMNGISNYCFDPSGTMTRGMLVTVLYRLSGSPDVNGVHTASFDDVSSEVYYADAITWAKANGIVNGVTESQFLPNDDVTREQAITIFYRYCVEYKGLRSYDAASLSSFADQSSLQNYSVDAMKWAVGVGLINGSTINNKTYLKPGNNLARCEGAAMLNRCCQKVLG